METLLHLSLKLPWAAVFGLVGGLLFGYMSAWSWAAIAKQRADLADIAWGPGFILVAWSALLLGHFTVYGLWVNILVSLWGIRLAVHLYRRNRNRDEDFRYQALKKDWPKTGWDYRFKIFSKVFLLQGALLYVIALPIIWMHTHPEAVHPAVFGTALLAWCGGFILEASADRQLALFKNDPANRGKLLTTGAWGHVRHPNYLGELIQWWAIWFMAAPPPHGWALAVSPLLLTFLIVKVSGVQPLEEELRKRADFKSYAERTPAWIPPSLLNGALYGLTWWILVVYGAQNHRFIPLSAALGCYVTQLILLAKCDPNSWRSDLPLSLLALALGMLQEMILMHFGLLAYPHHAHFPPTWILALYPLFSLTLNSSLAFLNSHLVLAFLLGGGGAVLAYLSGERLGAVQLFPPLAYAGIYLSWGLFLTILILLNRQLRAYVKSG